MNILITGVHGFVGSNLTASLKAEHTIYGLDIVSPDKEGVVRTFGWADLDNGSIPDVDVIIHLAGKAHDTKNAADAAVYFSINTGLTQKIYDYFLAHKSISKFIFFSTVKAAADKVEGNILTEDVIPSPVGPYGESKIKAEAYLQDHPAEGREVIILRPCMIHGPGNRGNLNLLYKVIRKGVPWPLGSFENRRTFTSVDNLSFVIGRLIVSDVQSGIYNMADDEGLSTNELIAAMCEAMGKKVRIWKISRGFIEKCALVGDTLHLPLNTVRLNKLTENYMVSNEKIKKAVGIKQMPVRARDGIVKTIKCFD